MAGFEALFVRYMLCVSCCGSVIARGVCSESVFVVCPGAWRVVASQPGAHHQVLRALHDIVRCCCCTAGAVWVLSPLLGIRRLGRSGGSGIVPGRLVSA